MIYGKERLIAVTFYNVIYISAVYAKVQSNLYYMCF